MHIGTPYSVRKVEGEVLTTQYVVLKGDEETTYVTDTYFIKDGKETVTFSRCKETKEKAPWINQ